MLKVQLDITGLLRRIRSEKSVLVQVAVFSSGILFLLAVSLYTSIILYRDISAGYTVNTPPLNKMSATPIPVPIIGGMSLASLIVYTIRGLSILLILLVVIVLLRGESTGRVILSLYGLMLLALGSGKVGFREVYLVSTVTLLLLYLHPVTRGWRQILRRKFPITRISGSAWITSFSIILFYIVPIGVSLGAADVIVGVSRALESRSLGVPPPLPDLWNVFRGSRLAILLVSLVVLGVFSWVVREFGDTLIYFTLITPGEAVRRVRGLVRRELRDLEMDRLWHQSIPTGLFVALASIFVYGYIILISNRITELFQEYLGGYPKYFPILLGLAVTVFAWGIVRREFRKILTLKGEAGINLKAIVLLVGLIGLILYYWQTGQGSLDPIYYALGLKQPSGNGDIIRKLGLWPSDFYKGLEGMFKNFENTARLVVRFLWG
ncbi:MAG: hypothetical protein GSR87_02630 [Desulfurococcales archaeon]|nr:hypothetical protein [Desulfurococcales archaeon]